MRCKECHINTVCKVASLLNEAQIVADIISCPYTAFAGTGINEVLATPHQRTIRNLATVAERIKEVSKSLAAKDKIGEEAIFCDICDASAADFICEGCGKHICANCSTMDLSTGKYYCEECYDNLEPTRF